MDGLREKSWLEFKNLLQNIDNLMLKRDNSYLNILKVFKDKLVSVYYFLSLKNIFLKRID